MDIYIAQWALFLLEFDRTSACFRISSQLLLKTHDNLQNLLLLASNNEAISLYFDWLDIEICFSQVLFLRNFS
jgi:hypothetical protein